MGYIGLSPHKKVGKKCLNITLWNLVHEPKRPDPTTSVGCTQTYRQGRHQFSKTFW